MTTLSQIERCHIYGQYVNCTYRYRWTMSTVFTPLGRFTSWQDTFQR